MELETSNIDLKRKVGIMEEVIKTYEEKLTSQAYQGILHGSAPPSPPDQPSAPPAYHSCRPIPPTPSCPQSHTCSAAPPPPTSGTICCYGTKLCSPHPHPPACQAPHACSPSSQTEIFPPSSTPSKVGPGSTSTCSSNKSEIKAALETIITLKESVNKLQCEVIDVVNNIDILSKRFTSDEENQSKPLYRNPQDIPNYDSIDVLEVAQVHAKQTDDSVVSVEEFVPDVDDTVDKPRSPLNSNLLTNQL